MGSLETLSRLETLAHLETVFSLSCLGLGSHCLGLAVTILYRISRPSPFNTLDTPDAW